MPSARRRVEGLPYTGGTEEDVPYDASIFSRMLLPSRDARLIKALLSSGDEASIRQHAWKRCAHKSAAVGRGFR